LGLGYYALSGLLLVWWFVIIEGRCPSLLDYALSGLWVSFYLGFVEKNNTVKIFHYALISAFF